MSRKEDLLVFAQQSESDVNPEVGPRRGSALSAVIALPAGASYFYNKEFPADTTLADAKDLGISLKAAMRNTVDQLRSRASKETGHVYTGASDVVTLSSGRMFAVVVITRAEEDEL